jgi:hypothetical protein
MARAALRMLHGRVGPGGETLYVGLLSLRAVHPNQMWRWVYDVVEDVEKSCGGGSKTILGVLNIERLGAARTCSSWARWMRGWSHGIGPRWHINTSSQLGSISHLVKLWAHA